MLSITRLVHADRNDFVHVLVEVLYKGEHNMNECDTDRHLVMLFAHVLPFGFVEERTIALEDVYLNGFPQLVQIVLIGMPGRTIRFAQLEVMLIDATAYLSVVPLVL